MRQTRLLLLVAVAGTLHAALLGQIGINWSGPTGGTLGSHAVSVSGLSSATLAPANLSTPDIAATMNFTCGVSVTFQ